MKKILAIVVLMLIGMICIGQDKKDINEINTGDTLVLKKSSFIGYTIEDPQGNIFEDLHKVKKGEYIVTSVNMDEDREPNKYAWTFMIRSLKDNKEHEVMMEFLNEQDFKNITIR